MIMRAESDILKLRENVKIELQKEMMVIAKELAEKIIKENIKEKPEIVDKSIDNFIDNIGE